MTEEQRTFLSYAYIYMQAKQMKKVGLFDNLTLEELVELLIRIK